MMFEHEVISRIYLKIAKLNQKEIHRVRGVCYR